jgi:hypothetical protein
MNDKSKRPPLVHATGMPVTDNPNVQTAVPRLLMCSQGDVQ